MNKSHTQHHLMPISVLILITALNVGIIGLFLMAHTGATGFVISGMQVYILAGVEFAGVIAAYSVGKRRNTTVSY